MLIKKIKLQNIRSYVDEEVSFGLGSTLLAGDIGSGKSTILLAMEFAIFGIKRGTLGGDFLLRHGAREGSVEINFAIENSDIVIKRNLKRGKDSVTQGAGYIIVNGVKTDLTAVELKSKILDILGYPKNLLSKSEDMIYRFTVYTPQEEMKEILFESRDNRVETIRKVFGIDRYRRIRENAILFTRNMREKRKELAGKIADLETKKSLKDEKEKELFSLSDKADALLPLLNDARKKLNVKKEEMLSAEADIKKLNEVKKEFSVNEANLRNSMERKKVLADEINSLKKQIELLERESFSDEEDFSEKIKQEEQNIEELDKTMRKIVQKLNEFYIIKKNSDDLKLKLGRIDKCPTCYQDVAKSHKDGIFSREDEKLKFLETEQKDFLVQQEKIKLETDMAKKELVLLRQKDKLAGMNKIKKRNYLEKKDRLKGMMTDLDNITIKIKDIEELKKNLSLKVSQMTGIDARHDLLRKEYEELQREERKIEIQKISVEKEAEGIKKMMHELIKEIGTKIKEKEDLIYLNELSDWINDFFVKLMETMEKNVMVHLHRQFNELFQNWFKILIEDDSINVRLDDEFSPMVQQNGYETNVENLSGGEKTSLALAYRLALNKVINDFIGEIKTKDLIILDEPTDGFSTEQLDKLRDVLEQLNLKQVVIVSHEAKIEGFVDRILRVEKREHVSRII